MNPYDFPREYERESLAKLMASLSAYQRRAARSYVRHVEYGDSTLRAWLEEGPHSPAASTWKKPFSQGGNYWGAEQDDPDSPFRRAVRLLIEGEESWRTLEEEKAVRTATRIYKMAAPAAAQVHVDLLTNSDPKERRMAAKEVADRAGVGVEENADSGRQPVEPEFVQQMIERVYGGGHGEDGDDGDDGD